jgi:hypothetical protein
MATTPRQTYQDALQRGQRFTGQLGNNILLIFCLGVTLLNNPQSDLGEFEFAHKRLADCSR